MKELMSELGHLILLLKKELEQDIKNKNRIDIISKLIDDYIKKHNQIFNHIFNTIDREKINDWFKFEDQINDFK